MLKLHSNLVSDLTISAFEQLVPIVASPLTNKSPPSVVFRLSATVSVERSDVPPVTSSVEASAVAPVTSSVLPSEVAPVTAKVLNN